MELLKTSWKNDKIFKLCLKKDDLSMGLEMVFLPGLQKQESSLGRYNPSHTV